MGGINDKDDKSYGCVKLKEIFGESTPSETIFPKCSDTKIKTEAAMVTEICQKT